MGYALHESACVDSGAVIGEGTRIWQFAVVHAGATIGKNCVLGQNVCVAGGAVIGDGVRIQNNVSVYCGVELEDHVFCGPSMVFTNVRYPRSEFPKDKKDYEKTLVRRGATLGAGSVIMAGTTIGRYALIGSGSVVTGDVPDHALMVGSPARRTGWACVCGHPLADRERACPGCGRKYELCGAGLRELAGKRRAGTHGGNV